jgi:hypothetical protein
VAFGGGVEASAVLSERGLHPHQSLLDLWAGDLPSEVCDLVYRPEAAPGGHDIAWAEALINESDWPLLPNLLPIMPVDERSFACVVLSDAHGPKLPGEGGVVRWHLDVKDNRFQAGVLDTDCKEYVWSVATELRHRKEGMKLIFAVGEAYQGAFLAKDKRPRDFIVRPVRIACQNVIVALAAFSQDSAFDGLGVVGWQTCEVSHVATNEANRALTALMLCDAFKNGGTMEVRFDRPARATGMEKEIPGHPEGKVPAALRRFARTVGVEGISDDATSISPVVARNLFRAVTPMPDDLRSRVDFATANEGIAPERIYFALMTGTWHPMELDFMLATSARTAAIISGGSEWSARHARQAETEICRAGLMTSMLFNRLNNHDSAGAKSGARVLEDDRQGAQWHVDGDAGSIEFSNVDASTDPPWLLHWPEGAPRRNPTLTVFPRSLVTSTAIEQVRDALASGACALLVPKDVDLQFPTDVPVLRCPDRLADLDKAIEAKLLTSRIARA